MVVWLFLMVMWVATGFDIDCNNITASPLSLNVTTAPSVRILNCTRRIAVNVPCGIDKDHLMRVEVVGGTTVPVFTLLSCTVNGVQSFSFATLTIRNVMMPKIAPENALDLQASSLFATLSVFTLSITVVDSQLQWTSGCLISCKGESSNIRDVNVSIANSSLANWDASGEVFGGVVLLSAANVQFVGVVVMNSSISIEQSSDTGNCLIYVYTDMGESIIIALGGVVVSALSEGTGTFYGISLTSYGTLGYVDRTNISVFSSTFVATVQTCFVVVAVPFARQLVMSNSRVSIVRCQVVATLSVGNLSTNDVSPPTALLFFGVPLSTERVSLLVLGVNMSVVRNMTGVPRTMTTLVGNTLGCVGLTYFGYANISQSTIEETESNLSIEDVGADVVAPYLPTAALGFAFVTVTYSVHFSVAALVVNSNITISNCNITVHRAVIDDSIIVALPGVQSGIAFWSLTAVALTGPVLESYISIQGTHLSAASLVYPDESSPLLKVWCVVAPITNAAPKVALAADQPFFTSLQAQILVLGFSSLDVNSSLIEITDTTMQLTPPLFSQLATPVRAALQRILFGIFVVSNAFNTTVLIAKCGFANITESITTATYDTTACLAWVSLAPSSTIDSVVISMSNAPRTTPDTSVPMAFLCASGSTIFRNSQCRIENLEFQAPERPSRSDSWDAIRLAPTSASFKTTLQLDNSSVYLRNTSFTNFRSLFGNITTPLLLSSANNVVLALSPLHFTVFSCTSNVWDNAPLIKYSDQLIWPTEVDLHATPNYSLITMVVDTGSAWCSLPRYSATLTRRFVPDGYGDATDLLSLAHQASIATTVVIGASLLMSSSIGASTLPRLQGIIGTFRLASRCQLATSSSGQNSDEGASSDSSGYVANDVSDNPLMLHFAPVAPSLAYAVGALIGNTLLLLVVGVVSHFLGVVEHHTRDSIRHETTGNLKRQFSADGTHLTTAPRKTGCLPSPAVVFVFFLNFLPTTPLPVSLMVFYGFLQEPTVGAAVACIASSDTGVVAVVLGVVVGCTWLALPCVFVWHVCVRHSPLPLATIPTRRVRSTKLRWERAGRMLEWLCAEREEWVAAVEGATRNAAARLMKVRFGALFEAFRGGRHWYFAVDVLLGALTGVVIGAAESVDSADACAAAVWGTSCVLAIAALSVVLCVVLRPHVVRCELLVAVCVSALAVVAAGLQLAGEMSASAAVSLAASVLALLPFVAGLAWRACKLEPSAPRHVVGDATSSAKRTRHAASADAPVLHSKRTKKVLPSNFLGAPARPAAFLAAAQQEEMLRLLLDCICRR